MRFVKTFLKVLRGRLIMALLRKYTHAETVPLVYYGAHQVSHGDIAVIQNGDRIELGEVVRADKLACKVSIRIFRRPK